MKREKITDLKTQAIFDDVKNKYCDPKNFISPIITAGGVSPDLDRLALEIKGLSPVDLKILRDKLADCGYWLLISGLPREQAAANLKRMIKKMEER